MGKPKYSFETAKQLIFDCAMELTYHTENISDDAIANKLLNIINELDKMKVIEGTEDESGVGVNAVECILS